MVWFIRRSWRRWSIRFPIGRRLEGGRGVAVCGEKVADVALTKQRREADVYNQPDSIHCASRCSSPSLCTSYIYRRRRRGLYVQNVFSLQAMPRRDNDH